MGPSHRVYQRCKPTNKNKRGRLTARKSTRVPTRSNTKNVAEGMLMQSMMPHRVPIQNDPPSVIDSVQIMKVVQLQTSPPTEGLNLTPALIASRLPGGATFWNRIRIEKISIWGDNGSGSASAPGSGSGDLFVLVPSDSGWDQPTIEWSDSGIFGQSRPKIAFKLGLLDRARWFNVASTQVLAQVGNRVAPSNPVLTIHFTVSVMSPATF